VKNNRTLAIKILFVSLAVMLVVYFTFNRQDQKRYQWIESYKVDSNEPYGTRFIQKLLATYRPGQKFTLNDKAPLHKILDTTKIEVRTDYVLIGQNIYLDEPDKNALLDFIYSGNDAFIATVNLPFDVIDPLFVSECDRDIFLTNNDTLFATLNFYNENIKNEKGYTYSYRFGKNDLNYFWNSVHPDIFCDSTKSITPLAYIHPDKVNFFKLSYGKGHLYVHTNPLVFTNYFLTKVDKAEYASGIFSHLRGEAMIWDEFSKSQFIPKNNAPEISPITYILQEESLRYAWWLMLAGAILYILFTAKRKQRIIPVLEEKANTSLEFVNMISALHFQNGNHHDIARKKKKYFLYFIRARYGIHLQELTELHFRRLSEKSKVKQEVLDSIAHEFDHIEHQSYYHEPRLINLQVALETFYKQCK
jgi:hypothetical protein